MKGGSFIKFGQDPQEQALTEGRNPLSSDFGKESPEDYGTLTIKEGEKIVKTKYVSETGTYKTFYNAPYLITISVSQVCHFGKYKTQASDNQP